MGADRNYLSVEVAPGTDPAALLERLTAGETFDCWSHRYDGTVVVAGRDSNRDPAVEKLRDVAPSVSRAFLLHVHDTATSGSGWVYEAAGDGLVLVEDVSGGERYGIDVVDYVKREYDIDGPR